MSKQKPAKIKINDADAIELERLPDIDRKLARRIIRHRQRYGLFQDVNELTNIRGMNADTFKKIESVIDLSESPKIQPKLAFNLKDRAEGPLPFSGYDNYLTGRIPLINKGVAFDDTVMMRFENTDLKDASGNRFDELALKLALKPNQQVEIPIGLQLHDLTPPGEHKADLVVGNARQRVVFYVAERVDISITPYGIILPTTPGAKIEKTLYIKNEGNLPVHIGSIGALGLEEENMICRTIRKTLSEVEPRKDDDYKLALTKFIDNLGDAFNDSLVLRVTNAEIDIQPGQTSALPITIALPSTIRKRRRYWGRIGLFNASVNIIVESNTTEADSEGD